MPDFGLWIIVFRAPDSFAYVIDRGYFIYAKNGAVSYLTEIIEKT
jgi:hypothetical protein